MTHRMTQWTTPWQRLQPHRPRMYSNLKSTQECRNDDDDDDGDAPRETDYPHTGCIRKTQPLHTPSPPPADLRQVVLAAGPHEGELLGVNDAGRDGRGVDTDRLQPLQVAAKRVADDPIGALEGLNPPRGAALARLQSDASSTGQNNANASLTGGAEASTDARIGVHGAWRSTPRRRVGAHALLAFRDVIRIPYTCDGTVPCLCLHARVLPLAGLLLAAG